MAVLAAYLDELLRASGERNDVDVAWWALKRLINPRPSERAAACKTRDFLAGLSDDAYVAAAADARIAELTRDPQHDAVKAVMQASLREQDVRPGRGLRSCGLGFF